MSHRVTLQPSNIIFEVLPDETILAAALRQGINLPYGCRSGSCGTCKSLILKGEVSYTMEQSLSLSEAEKNAGATLLCQAHATSDLNIEAHIIPSEDEIEIKKLPCRLIEKKLLCHDVMQLWLKLPIMENFVYHAGQYVDILLPDGRRRSFSLANAPYLDGTLELHIRHVEGGDFTGYVFNELQDKAILRIEGPLGQFYLREDSQRPVIFMAGGTGFAPIKGIIEHCIHHNIERTLYLYWGVRAQEDLYMHELANRWTQEFKHIRYIPVLSAPKPGDDPQIRGGYVHNAIIADFADLSGFDVYASGPPAMIESARDVFQQHHLPLTQYYSDAFEFQEPKKI